jgi:hypothetical protein
VGQLWQHLGRLGQPRRHPVHRCGPGRGGPRRARRRAAWRPTGAAQFLLALPVVALVSALAPRSLRAGPVRHRVPGRPGLLWLLLARLRPRGRRRRRRGGAADLTAGRRGGRRRSASPPWRSRGRGSDQVAYGELGTGRDGFVEERRDRHLGLRPDASGYGGLQPPVRRGVGQPGAPGLRRPPRVGSVPVPQPILVTPERIGELVGDSDLVLVTARSSVSATTPGQPWPPPSRPRAAASTPSGGSASNESSVGAGGTMVLGSLRRRAGRAARSRRAGRGSAGSTPSSPRPGALAAYVRRTRYPPTGCGSTTPGWACRQAPLSDLLVVSWNHPGFTLLLRASSALEPDAWTSSPGRCWWAACWASAALPVLPCWGSRRSPPPRGLRRGREPHARHLLGTGQALRLRGHRHRAARRGHAPGRPPVA